MAKAANKASKQHVALKKGRKPAPRSYSDSDAVRIRVESIGNLMPLSYAL